MSGYRARNAARGRRHTSQGQDYGAAGASYTCACGKQGYKSRKVAALQARRWQGKGIRGVEHGVKLRVYQCPDGGLHLTSQDAATRACYKDRGMR
jgi:hypothetical protein